MEVLRGKSAPTSVLLGLRFQADPTSLQTDFLPFLIGNRVDVERARIPRGVGKSTSPAPTNFQTKYILRELIWGGGTHTAHKVRRGLNRVGMAGNDGGYVGLSLTLPDLTYTTHCLGRSCRDCHLWDPCIDGGLPFGWFANVTVDAYHLSKKFNASDDDHAPEFLDGGKATTLTVHGIARPREVLSLNKDLFLPQTWKSASELRAKDPEPQQNEEE
jgi:hypothetical protein